MRIDAVIFDRDHTLVHFDRQRMAGLSAELAAISPSLTAEAAQRYWARWPGPWPRLASEEPVFWRRFWYGFAAENGLNDHQVDRLTTDIGPLYHTLFTPYPDTLAVLQTLHRRGLRLAILTNFELPSIDLTLSYAGIDPQMFSVMLSSGALGVAKPDPQAFYAAAAALALPPERCAFVDDLAEHVAAARAIGMHAYQIVRQGVVPDDPACVNSLDVLLERLSPFFTACRRPRLSLPSYDCLS